VLRSQPLLFAFAASASLALILASSVAVVRAADSDGDGVPDDIELATQRTVAATWSASAINISSSLTSGRLSDDFELSYQAGTFDLWYDQPGVGSASYRLRLLNLVEWVDLNGNGRIDPGEVMGTSILGGAAFGNVPIIGSNTSNADGGRVYTFTIRSNTRDVTLNLTIAQRFMRLGDRVLTPMEAKLDLTVNHTFARTNASLGIEMQINTQDQVQFSNRSWDEDNGFAQSDSSVNFTGPPGRAASVFLSWATTAFADGVRIPVGLTSRQIGATNGYDLYLAYPMSPAQPGVKIVHDPELGVDSGVYRSILAQMPALQGDLALYAGSVVAIAALVVVSIVVARRRRKKPEE
jgi:hypothetical protein